MNKLTACLSIVIWAASLMIGLRTIAQVSAMNAPVTHPSVVLMASVGGAE